MDKVSEVWDAIVERVRNPFLSSFIISWLAVNYKLVLVATSSEFKLAEKFVFVDNYVAAPQALAKMVGWPTAGALLYTVVLPFANTLFSYLAGVFERWRCQLCHQLFFCIGCRAHCTCHVSPESWPR